MSSCAGTRLALGAYVLGALDCAERAEVDAHLAGCGACRDELVALAPMPGLLSRVAADEDAAPPAAASPDPLERALHRVRRERRSARRRQRWVAAFAAVAVAAALVTVAVAPWRSSDSPAPAVPALATLSATDPGTHVSATAQLRPKAWGTEIGLRLQGVPPEEHCRLVAVGADSAREIAGSWEATYQGAVTVTNATSIQAAQLRELRVVTFDGRTLVAIRVDG